MQRLRAGHIRAVRLDYVDFQIGSNAGDQVAGPAHSEQIDRAAPGHVEGDGIRLNRRVPLPNEAVTAPREDSAHRVVSNCEASLLVSDLFVN